MRAFIFSLDAFVAFTLALVAIYSLIFFSSVPSAYYYLLTQGHYLSRDVLLSLSTATCGNSYGSACSTPADSVLDNIVQETQSGNSTPLIQSTVGAMIPLQFGYVMEMSSDKGGTWNLVYDTASVSSDQHAKVSKKLTVTTQVITFGYSGKTHKFLYSPYNYLTCHGDGYGDNLGGGAGGAGGGGGGATGSGDDNFGTITCGTFNSSGGGGSNGSGGGTGTGGNFTVPLGNTYPGNVLGGDIVPSSDVRLVRLTVYI